MSRYVCVSVRVHVCPPADTCMHTRVHRLSSNGFSRDDHGRGFKFDLVKFQLNSNREGSFLFLTEDKTKASSKTTELGMLRDKVSCDFDISCFAL